jgi:hypothetical protein
MSDGAGGYGEWKGFRPTDVRSRCCLRDRADWRLAVILLIDAAEDSGDAFCAHGNSERDEKQPPHPRGHHGAAVRAGSLKGRTRRRDSMAVQALLALGAAVCVVSVVRSCRRNQARRNEKGRQSRRPHSHQIVSKNVSQPALHEGGLTSSVSHL